MTISKEAQKEYNRQYYLLHRDKLSKKSKTRYSKRAEWLRGIKEKLFCSKCGEKHIACLDFHHRNPKEKDMGVGKLCTRASHKRILAEMDKCDVLCKNCHAKFHWEEKYGTTKLG